MSVKLKQIDDPEKVEVEKTAMPDKLTLRAIEPQEKLKDKEGKDVIKKQKISEEALALAKKETIKRFNKEVKCQEVFDRVSEGIQQKITRKTYYVGNDRNKLFCGPVIQIIPIGTFAQITSGQSTYSAKVPIEGKKFKFERSRQIMVKVGKRVGKDFVVVVGLNGCVILESFSYAVFNMPVYIVEPTADFYYVNRGKRNIYLGPGSHLILYAMQAVIIFSKQTVKSEKVESLIKSITDSKSLSQVKGKETEKTKVNKIEKEQNKVENEKKDDKSEISNESKPESPKDKRESEKQKPEKLEVKPEPEKPETKPEPEKPETKPEPEKPETKPGPDKPEVEPEPEKPETKPEPEKPKTKLQTEKLEVKPKLEIFEVKPESEKSGSNQMKPQTIQAVEPTAEAQPQQPQQHNRQLNCRNLFLLAVIGVLLSIIVVLLYTRK